MMIHAASFSIHDLYRGTAMDRMVAQAKVSAGPLNDYFYGRGQGAPQMVFEGLPPYFVMNLDEYQPGIFFNATA